MIEVVFRCPDLADVSNLESTNASGRTVRHHVGDGGEREFPRPVFVDEEDLVIKR